MKNAKLVFIILICIVLLCAAVLCYMFRPYHSVSEFDWVVIGETTFDDICWFTAQLMVHTSFGGVAEFRTIEGNTIQIIYYGPELVVGDIIVVE